MLLIFESIYALDIRVFKCMSLLDREERRGMEGMAVFGIELLRGRAQKMTYTMDDGFENATAMASRHLGNQLKQIKQACTKQKEESARKVRAVIGSEAADLDSIASSICYSAILTYQSEVLAAPIISCEEEDMQLRPDAEWLLHKLNIDTSDLFFVGGEMHWLHNEVSEIVLVDQNNLAPAFESLATHVVAIIDHHEDEGAFHEASVSKQIESVGSCSTLIAERFMELIGNGQSLTGVAELLLGAITIDTGMLRGDQAGPRDVEAAQWLSKISKIGMEELYTAISSRRRARTSHSTRSLLRLDSKERRMGNWRVGISTLPGVSASEVIARTDLDDEGARVMAERRLDLLALVCVHDDGRELLWRGANSIVKRLLVDEGIVSDNSREIVEGEWHALHLPRWCTRKKLLPAFWRLSSNSFSEG